MTRKGTISLLMLAVLFAGCAETPKQPVMRPIPPPPPTPPPGAVYTAPMVALNTNGLTGGTVSTSAPPAAVAGSVPSQPTNSSGLEVTSNFVGNAQSAAVSPAPGQVQIVQPAPQYEVVPPRPGPDYMWKDGYWQWNNGWVWIPGTWVYTAPSVIIVPEPWYYHRPYYYHRYRRW